MEVQDAEICKRHNEIKNLQLTTLNIQHRLRKLMGWTLAILSLNFVMLCGIVIFHSLDKLKEVALWAFQLM